MNPWIIFYLVLVPVNAIAAWNSVGFYGGFFWFMTGVFSLISVIELTEPGFFLP